MLPTFRGNLVPSSYWTAGPLKKGSVVRFETTVTNDQPTPHYIPEEQTPQVHPCVSLKTRKFEVIHVDFLAHLGRPVFFY